jgi:hypothetical protein
MPASAQSGGSTTATGTSRAFNPAISVNGLFLGMLTSREAGEHDHEAEAEDEHDHAHGGPEEGLQVQEVEVQLTSFVDPYLKADIVLAMHGTEGIELEEGFVTTLGLPAGLTLKAGKFYADFGKHGPLHTHQFPFVDAPLAVAHLLGPHPLNEVGIGLSYLLPTSWYGEISAQVLNGDNPVFDAEDGRDLAYLGHLKNFWDLGESTTLELGGSYAWGKNHFDELSRLAGADLTIKWRPTRQAIYRSLTWQTEYLYAAQDHGADIDKVGGIYTTVQYQFARRWWAQGRYDLLGLPREEEEEERDSRVSALLAFVPSEFSSLRLQYSYVDEEGEDGNELFLQFNFTIGSHPAHRY